MKMQYIIQMQSVFDQLKVKILTPNAYICTIIKEMERKYLPDNKIPLIGYLQVPETRNLEARENNKLNYFFLFHFI